MFLKHQHDIVVFQLRILTTYVIVGRGTDRGVTIHYPQYLLEWFMPIFNRRWNLLRHILDPIKRL